MDTTHETTTLTVEVRVNLLLEGGLVEVSGANGDTDGGSLLVGAAGDVLEHSEGGINATALLEEGADSATGTLGGDENDVDTLGDVNLGEILEDDRETMGEIESLAGGDEGFDVRPGLGLGGVREKVHDDVTLADGLVDVKKGLAWNPAILLSGLPGGTVFSDTNDDVETVITEVKTLSVS